MRRSTGRTTGRTIGRTSGRIAGTRYELVWPVFFFPSQWSLEVLEVLGEQRWRIRKGCVVSSQPFP